MIMDYVIPFNDYYIQVYYNFNRGLEGIHLSIREPEPYNPTFKDIMTN